MFRNNFHLILFYGESNMCKICMIYVVWYFPISPHTQENMPIKSQAHSKEENPIDIYVCKVEYCEWVNRNDDDDDNDYYIYYYSYSVTLFIWLLVFYSLHSCLFPGSQKLPPHTTTIHRNSLPLSSSSWCFSPSTRSFSSCTFNERWQFKEYERRNNKKKW